MDKLIKIQSELKAPKGQHNAFGKYKYRSAEDILEAVKPLLKKYECLLTIKDKFTLIGDRYYVKAIARFVDGENVVKVSAYAREEGNKKGMDSSQISGAASSYARKYALNGLFLIDDNKDSDNTNTEKQEDEERLRVISCIEKAKDVPSLCRLEDNLTKNGKDTTEYISLIEEKKFQLIEKSEA